MLPPSGLTDPTAKIAKISMPGPSPAAASKAQLRPPEAPRTGGLPRRKVGFRALVLTGVTAALLATVPLGQGAALAETQEAPRAEVTEVVQQRGVPRDMVGEVKRAVVPGTKDDGLWVNLGRENRVFIDGVPFEQVFLGAVGSEAVKGLNQGDQINLGGRIEAKTDGKGTYASLVSTVSLMSTPYAGSDVQPPRYDGKGFTAPDRTPMKHFVLDCVGSDQHIVVIDNESGLAYAGVLTDHGAGFDGFASTSPVLNFIRGGPEFAVKGEAVVHPVTGDTLRPLGVKAEKNDGGETRSGWYVLDGEAHQSLVHLSYVAGADTVRADKQIMLEAAPTKSE